MASVGPPLKYAVVERERRFLLPNPPDGLRPPTRIEDHYLSGTRLRLRETVEPDGVRVRKAGHKVRLEAASAREVACTSLYLDEVEWALLVDLPAVRLRKRRHLEPLPDPDGLFAVVDVFEGPLTGLVLAEVDCGDQPDRRITLPFPVLAEVTDDERFTGGWLAAATRSDLRTAASQYGLTLAAD